jgi:hypothetical protein
MAISAHFIAKKLVSINIKYVFNKDGACKFHVELFISLPNIVPTKHH